MRCTSGTVKACVFLLLVTLGKVDVAAPVRNRTEDLPIVFPDENVPAGAPSPRREVRNDSFGSGRTSSQNKIPESLLFRMRDVKNLTDFVSQFLEGYQSVASVDDLGESPSILGKKGPVGGQASDPEPGTCIPSKELVEFPKPTDPTIILWPPCTRVPRCGGCCPSSILKCAPTKTTNVTYKVIKAQYPEQGASKFNFVGHEMVTVVKHEKCGCECKEKPSDCNQMQDYQECRCICRNANQMRLCTAPGMFWDNRECRCKCKDFAECSTGFFFNVRTCRCDQLTARARIGPRVLPLPKMFAPYTDNRENVQSRSYRNLDILSHDEYSGTFNNAHIATTVKRDTARASSRAQTLSTSSSASSSSTSPSQTSSTLRSSSTRKSSSETVRPST